MEGGKVVTAGFRRPSRIGRVVTLGLLDLFEPPAHPDYVRTPFNRPAETIERFLVARALAACVGVGVVAGAVPTLLSSVPEVWLTGSVVPTFGPVTSVLLGVAIYAWNIRRMKRLAFVCWTERRVGQFLDRLEREGARVVHDLTFDGFNVDHLVIHPTGVHAVETKGVRPPRRHGGARIVVHTDGPRMASTPMAGNPVAQSERSARPPARSCGNWGSISPSVRSSPSPTDGSNGHRTRPTTFGA